jgi:putative Mn2+ efflux pump MntP
MYQILFGSLVLSAIHAVIPNHWLPIIAIGRTEKWNNRETLSATLITGISHTVSTIIIGIIVGFIGISLSKYYEDVVSYAAPCILTVIGIIYIISDRLKRNHSHNQDHEDIVSKSHGSSKRAILFSLSLAMFLTPCIEIEAYYFQAAMIGWTGILIVSSVYLFITVFFMLILVFLGKRGVRNIRSHFLEHHEKLVTGVVLVILGVSSIFISY